MKLIIIVLCLLSERFLIHQFALKRFQWFSSYVSFISNKISTIDNDYKNYIITAVVILPIVLGVFFIVALTNNIFFGFLSFFIYLMIFYYCLGPNNVFFPFSSLGSEENTRVLSPVDYYFIQVNQQLFAIIFWFLIAGPVGLILYRLLILCSQYPITQSATIQITNYLDWVTARVTAFFYLLAGNFQQAFPLYTKMLLSPPESNDVFLSTCGEQAVLVNQTSEISITNAQKLVEHALILFVVFIAFLTVISWL